MDTLTILKTMRAVVADVEPERFDMECFFDIDTNCGCILGLSALAQPHLARHLRVSRPAMGSMVVRGTRVGARTVYAEMAGAIGITLTESEYLFATADYGQLRGEAGKAEALRHLDKMIAKYTPSGADTRSGLRLSSVT